MFSSSWGHWQRRNQAPGVIHILPIIHETLGREGKACEEVSRAGRRFWKFKEQGGKGCWTTKPGAVSEEGKWEGV